MYTISLMKYLTQSFLVLGCTEDAGEIIFVPSGWYHQFHNLVCSGSLSELLLYFCLILEVCPAVPLNKPTRNILIYQISNDRVILTFPLGLAPENCIDTISFLDCGD